MFAGSIIIENTEKLNNTLLFKNSNVAVFQVNKVKFKEDGQ